MSRGILVEDGSPRRQKPVAQMNRWSAIGCLLWLMVLAFPAATDAQETPFPAPPERDWLIKRWETEDGLPENSATSMVQTPDGFLWFGTFNGLVRFDGVQFAVFNTGNVPELPGNGIVNLHLDQRGRLWIATLDGLALLEDGRWRRIELPSVQSDKVVRTFAERMNGDLLLTFFDGPVMEVSGDRFTLLPNPPGQPREGYQGISDSEGRWWVVQHRFIGRWNGHEWIERIPSASLAGLSNDSVSCARARQGGHWVLRGSVLTRFAGDGEVQQRFLSERPGGVWSMAEDSRGHLWICTHDQGLCELLPSNQIRRWTAPASLAHNGTRFVFEDREANRWIGTSGGGLTRLKRRRVLPLGAESGLTEPVVKSVSPDGGGNVWVATYGHGMFRGNDLGLTPVVWPGRPSDPFYIQSVLADRSGRVWAGTFRQGLWMSDGSDFQTVGHRGLAGGNCIALFEDSRQRLWISGGTGVACHEAGTFQEFGAAEGLPPSGVRCFAEDPQGRIWMSNLQGLFRIEGRQVVEVTDPQRGAIRQIACMRCDPDGTFWMGSLDEGLWRWRGGAWTRIGPEEGLPVSSVGGILEDDLQNFWLASGRGVVRVARADLEARADGRRPDLPSQLLDRSDGLPSVECARGQQPVCGRDASGRFWFATLKGLVMMDPRRFQVNRIAPRTLIQEVAYQAAPDRGVSGAPGGTPPRPSRMTAPFPAELRLPRDSRRIEIRFTAPSFPAPEKMRFQAMLEGEDSDWRDLGNRRVAYFENLKPGRHRFRVRAANEDGVWDETGAALALFMPPRFWQTRWFQGLVAGAVLAEGGLIAGLAWSQRRRRRAEMEVQRQRAELAHFSRVMTVGELTTSLAHELNHPQSAILSNAQAGELFLAANPPAVDEVRKILSDIVRDNRRSTEIIHRLRSFLRKRELEFEAVDVNALLKEIALLVESDARARRVDLVLAPALPLPPARADHVHLQQVLLNLVLNALDALATVSGGIREIHLQARPQGSDWIEVRIRDTGPGIPKDRLSQVFEPFFTSKPQGMGMGLSIARTLLEAHGGRICAENHPEGGAVLCFTLPAMKSPHE